MIRQQYHKTFIIITIITTTSTLNCFNWFGKKSQETPEHTITQHQKYVDQQPDSPVARYNLGVAQYHANKFAQACEQFELALKNTQQNSELSKRCLFNAAASCLQKTHAMLPESWETKEIDQNILDQAIQSVKQSIEHLKQYRTMWDSDKKASAAQNFAEKLLKKLEDKKRQQEQQNKQDDQKQQQDDKKDQKDKQKDQNKQNKQQNEQDNKQSQSDQQSDQKDDQNRSDNKKDIENKQSKGDQGKTESSGDSNTEKPHESDQKRDDQVPDHQDDKDSKQSDVDKNHTQKPQSSSAQDTQPKDETQDSTQQDSQSSQDSAEIQEETSEMRGLRAMLENLQSDESKTQKRMLLRQTKSQKMPQAPGQKPW